ncbi:hypothetical protein KHQ89_05590 [Mycoplasmatota bacterium]|nr:hypothetical protein KHQ89_05590 [Mycoplasmatota bacterium]
MIKKLVITLSMILIATLLISCQDSDSLKSYVKESSNKIEIGIENRYHFSFSNSDNQWLFDGVYAGEDNKLIFDSQENDFFRFAELQYNKENEGTTYDTKINSVEVVEINNEKKVVVKNEDASLTLSIDEGSTFIKRTFTLNNDIQNQLSAFQLSFTLRTNPNEIIREYGSIATKSPSELQADLPYAFPALYTKLFSDETEYNVINVVDYKNSDRIFGKMRKRSV